MQKQNDTLIGILKQLWRVNGLLTYKDIVDLGINDFMFIINEPTLEESIKTTTKLLISNKRDFLWNILNNDETYYIHINKYVVPEDRLVHQQHFKLLLLLVDNLIGIVEKVLNEGRSSNNIINYLSTYNDLFYSIEVRYKEFIKSSNIKHPYIIYRLRP